jgi:beta-phosphoglucomutase-like phosphatase (HAD superfamily)
VGTLMIEAVIFDIDGTLVDSVDLHAKAWQVAFEKFGKEVSFGAIRRQIGKGADQLLPVFSKDELDQFGDELKAYKKIARIDDLIQTETSSGDVKKSKPHPDVFAAALEELGNIPPCPPIWRALTSRMRYLRRTSTKVSFGDRKAQFWPS